MRGPEEESLKSESEEDNGYVTCLIASEPYTVAAGHATIQVGSVRAAAVGVWHLRGGLVLILPAPWTVLQNLSVSFFSKRVRVGGMKRDSVR